MFLGLINKYFSFVSEEIDPSSPLIFAGGFSSSDKHDEEVIYCEAEKVARSRELFVQE